MVIFALKRVRPFTRIFEKEGKSRLMNVVNGRELAALDVGLPTIHQCPVVAVSSSSPLVRKPGDSRVWRMRMLLTGDEVYAQYNLLILQDWLTVDWTGQQNIPNTHILLTSDRSTFLRKDTLVPDCITPAIYVTIFHHVYFWHFSKHTNWQLVHTLHQ